MQHPKVTIIILNFNGWKDTIKCLESLSQISYPNYSVLIVDNNSSDESTKKIKEYFEENLKIYSKYLVYNPINKSINPTEYTEKKSKSLDVCNSNDSTSKKCIIISNDKNYGFAEGNNIGIRYALKHTRPDYILLLNNDTVVDKNFLEELVNNGETDEKIGILGPKIYYYDKPNVIWSAGCKIAWKTARGIHIGINELDQGQHDKKQEVEYISGSAFFIKTEVIKKIGLMDKIYFLYFEESDWTLRANQAGYKSLYVPTAKIWHKVSQSGGGITKPTGLYYITRNRWIFMRKWAKKSDYGFFMVYQIFGAAFFPLILTIHYREFGLFKSYYKGLVDGI